MIKIGDRYKIEGVSKEGKERIKEHGEIYTIMGINKFLKEIRINSENTNYFRWVSFNEDKHFKIKTKL